MTRKDYIALAEAFKLVKPEDERGIEQWETDLHIVAQVLADDNPRFDFAKFYAAAGWEAHGTKGHDSRYCTACTSE